MKFEEVKVGDFLDGGNGLYLRVFDKNDKYISGTAVNLCNIYGDSYTATEIVHFCKSTKQDFEEALRRVCNHYTSGEYIKVWEEK